MSQTSFRACNTSLRLTLSLSDLVVMPDRTSNTLPQPYDKDYCMRTLTLHAHGLHRNFYNTKILGLLWASAGTRIFESTGCDIETLQDGDTKYKELLSVVNCVRKAVNKQTRWSIRRYGGLKKPTLGYANRKTACCRERFQKNIFYIK